MNMTIIRNETAYRILGQQDMYGYAAGTSAMKYPAGVAAPNVNVSMAGLPQGSGLAVDRRTSPTQAWSGSAYRVSSNILYQFRGFRSVLKLGYSFSIIKRVLTGGWFIVT